jgi:hypothetical protein
MSSLFRIHLATAMLIALAVPMHLLGQNAQPSEQKMATVVGTATAVNGDPVPDATIELKSSDSNDRRTLVMHENGFFEFHDLKPGVSYEISANAKDLLTGSPPTSRSSRASSKL